MSAKKLTITSLHLLPPTTRAEFGPEGPVIPPVLYEYDPEPEPNPCRWCHAPLSTDDDVPRFVEGGFCSQHCEDEHTAERDPTCRRVELHTAAPAVYDGFSTRTEAVVGKDRNGQDVRRISIQMRDLTWQTDRYASGLHSYTDERMTLEAYVRLGQWKMGG